MSPVTPLRYRALALQLATRSVGRLPDVQQAREQIMRNIGQVAERIGAVLEAAGADSALPVRLIVLPEYSLTGSPAPGAFAAWRRLAALAPSGPEYEALAAIAQRHGLYLGGNAYEADPAFPELYFQACFLFAPSGERLLCYRRLVSLYSPSPYDVLEPYLEVHGSESLFPVADTGIGRIAAIASEEILYPEIARCHAMRGAELFIHPTSEMGSPQPTAKDVAKRARAAENLAYLVSANTAGVENTPLPMHSSTGMSKVVDYDGRVIAVAPGGGESHAALAEVDLAALRARRRQPGLTNVLARQPFQAYAESYRSAPFHAAGQLEAAGTTAETATLRATQLRTIERLARLGLI